MWYIFIVGCHAHIRSQQEGKFDWIKLRFRLNAKNIPLHSFSLLVTVVPCSLAPRYKNVKTKTYFILNNPVYGPRRKLCLWDFLHISPFWRCAEIIKHKEYRRFAHFFVATMKLLLRLLLLYEWNKIFEQKRGKCKWFKSNFCYFQQSPKHQFIHLKSISKYHFAVHVLRMKRCA